MKLHFYADDSTSKKLCNTFVFAGLLAPESIWPYFEREWQDCLQIYPKIERFKMSEAHSLQGNFRGLSGSQRDKKVADLSALLPKFAVKAFSVIIDGSSFYENFKDWLNDDFQDPFVLSVSQILSNIFHWRNICKLNCQIDLTFDSDERSQRIQALWEQRKFSAPFFEVFPRAPQFEPEEKHGALQAADLFVWHVRRGVEDRKPDGLAQTAALNALSKVPHRSLTLAGDEMKAKFAEVRSTFGTAMPPLEVALRARSQAAMMVMTENVVRLLGLDGNQSDIIELDVIPAIGLKRFQLLYSCPRIHIPHLHKRSGNICLGT